MCVVLAGACKGSQERKSHDAGGAAVEAVPKIVATCADLMGSAEARRKGEQAWQPIEIGATFRERDWVRTGAETYARLRFSDRRFMDMLEHTTILIDSAISIESGTLVGVAGGGESLQVKAADGTIAQIVAGAGEDSELRISPTKDSGLEIAVTKGQVKLVTAAGEASLVAGEASDLANNAASAGRKLLAPPTGLSSPERVTLGAEPLQVALGWDAVEGAARYRLQVARDAAFRKLMLDQEQAETAATLAPDAVGDYVWRVASIDESGRVGTYGASRTVKVDPEPIPDRLLSPAPGAKIGFADRSPKVAFTWRSAGKDMQYRLVVVRGTDLGAEPVATVTTSARRAEVKTLREGTYHWGVYAVSETEERPLFPAPRALTIRKQRVKVHTEKLWQSPR